MHIVQTLIGVVDTTGCYIPLGPFIFEFFDTNILRQRTTEEDDLPPFVMKLHLKTPKEYSQTKTYQVELVIETTFFFSWRLNRCGIYVGCPVPSVL